MLISLAQIDLRIADFQYNYDKIINAYEQSVNCQSKLVIYPELAISGYNSMDRLFEIEFMRMAFINLINLTKATSLTRTSVLIGCQSFGKEMYRLINSNISKNIEEFDEDFVKQHMQFQDVYNSAFLIEKGLITKVWHKNNLPNFKLFNEKRYFIPASVEENKQTIFKGKKIGVLICEDMWHDHLMQQYFVGDKDKIDDKYEINEIDFIISINASPFSTIKSLKREKMIHKQATHYNTPIVYVNSFGSQDHILFDGGSFILDSTGNYLVKPVFWKEKVIHYNIENSVKLGNKNKRVNNVNAVQFTFHNKDKTEDKSKEIEERSSNNVEKIDIQKYVADLNLGNLILTKEQLAHVYCALVNGTRDYMRHNNFKKAIIGLSGGLDSALVAVIACDAVGSENVTCITMPSEFSSITSYQDAEHVVKTTRCNFQEISITEINAFLKSTISQYCAKEYGELQDGELASQNLQARIRAIILMTLSNKTNHILLNTSNKSEVATGYTTLYGDMCGGLSVIGDLYKTQVLQLAKWRNQITQKTLIETINGDFNLLAGFEKMFFNESVLTKEPTAELKPDQKDSETLPSYNTLDNILFLLIEKKYSRDDIIDFMKKERNEISKDKLEEVINMVNRAEFKRFQSPCTLRISEMSFKYDRQYPIEYNK